MTDANAARQQRGRDFAKDGLDLAPLQPVLRVARSSRSAPPPSDHSGRAFWLVAVAVVALSGIVAIFSMRAAREDGQPESAGHQANADTQRSARASGEEPAAKHEPAATEGAEHALAQPGDAVTGLPTDVGQTPGSTADTRAHDSTTAAQPAAATQGASNPQPTAAEPGNLAQTTAQTPTGANAAPSANAQPNTAYPAATQPNANAAVQASADTNPPAAMQPSAASNASAQSSANPAAADTNTQPAGASTGSAASNVNAQPSTASSTADTHPQLSADSTAAAKPASNPLPKLGPGEIAHIVTFTSRPSGASIFVGEQQTVTPGELNLGAMPAKIRVTAQKEGYEPSTVWINPTSEFQKVGAVMRREAHFVLKELSAAPNANTPAAPSSTPAPQRGAATAPATPAPSSATAVPQAQNAAPAAPSSASSASSTHSNPQPAVTEQAPSAPSANPEPAPQQP